MSKVYIDGLVKKYESFLAIDNIDLAIEEGEFVVFLGPSGCGKTTTLRCVAGLEDISGGTISIGSEVMSSAAFSVPAERRQMGMVFQSYAIWPHMTVFENLAFGLKVKGLAAGEISRRVASALELVGLPGYGDRSASQMSGGQLQRVALARAIVLEPRVLLFDEPLSNLDAKLREKMRSELRQLQKELSVTSIYVTHDQQEAMVMADRIVLMESGRIAQVDAPRLMYDRPRSLFAANFIGSANAVSGTLWQNGVGSDVRFGSDYVLRSADTGHKDGANAVAIIRPERIILSPDHAEGVNVFRGNVVQCVFLGNGAEITLRVGDLELKSYVSPAVDYQIGTAVTIRINPESVVIVDEMH